MLFCPFDKALEVSSIQRLRVLKAIINLNEFGLRYLMTAICSTNIRFIILYFSICGNLHFSPSTAIFVITSPMFISFRRRLCSLSFNDSSIFIQPKFFASNDSFKNHRKKALSAAALILQIQLLIEPFDHQFLLSIKIIKALFMSMCFSNKWKSFFLKLEFWILNVKFSHIDVESDAVFGIFALLRLCKFCAQQKDQWTGFMGKACSQSWH